MPTCTTSSASLRMVEDEIGQEAPNVVPMSWEARRLFKEIHDEIGRETLEPGLPAEAPRRVGEDARLLGPHLSGTGPLPMRRA